MIKFIKLKENLMSAIITITSLLNKEVCSLKIKPKERSTLNCFDIYRENRWVVNICRNADGTYRCMSYITPLCQLEIDAIGKKIEQINNGFTAYINKFALSIF